MSPRARALTLAALACLLGPLPACGPGPEPEPGPAHEVASTPEPTAEAEAPPKVEGVAWAGSFADAVERAKAAETLVMIDFTTDWCGWCKRLDADTYTNPDVIRLTERVVPVKLDAEKEGRPQAAQYLPERSYPAVLFLDPQSGDIVGKIMGYLPPEPFAKELRTILQSFEEFATLQARLQADPDDLEAIGELAWIAVRREDFRRAQELIDRGEQIDPENAKGHLTKSYLSLGDAFQARNLADDAANLYRKAAGSARTPEQVAYARLSLAECARSLGKHDEATAALEAITAMPDAPAKDRDEARRRLDEAKP